MKLSYDFSCIYKPCELYPFIPPEGLLKEKLLSGYDMENIYKKLRILGKRNDIQFGKLERKYNSHMSLLLSEYAIQNNKIVEFSNEVYKQYYINDIDISNLDVLKNICEIINLDFDKALISIKNNELENKLVENQKMMYELNIEIFPTYIINDESILSGILTKRTFVKTFESLGL